MTNKVVNKNNKKATPVVFKLGELFCGPGGIALGAKNSSFSREGIKYSVKHVWANDYDADSCETYKNNICPHNSVLVVNEDVKTLNIASLPKIDAFAYGFPCNDFSIVGEKKGINGKYGPLYSYGVKVINHFKPKFFIAENVGGIRSSNAGEAFRKILKDFAAAGDGYNLTVNLYKSEEYGIPQTRHRIIIVGIDKKFDLKFGVPAPTTKNNPVTSREAIENPKITSDLKNNELTNQSSLVVERLKHIKPGENAWNSKLPERLRLNVKSVKLSHIYKRLHPDKPAYTITGSGGGGTHVYHWNAPRALTNRERARIQTFPDGFVFSGSKESVRKQIGMAVPPKLSEVIFKSVLKTFAGVKYKSVESNLSL